jgi:hypothetical protein
MTLVMLDILGAQHVVVNPQLSVLGVNCSVGYVQHCEVAPVRFNVILHKECIFGWMKCYGLEYRRRSFSRIAILDPAVNSTRLGKFEHHAGDDGFRDGDFLVHTKRPDRRADVLRKHATALCLRDEFAVLARAFMP